MSLQIDGFLNADQVAYFRRALNEASWIDGSATAGHLSHRVKRNRQLPETDAAAVQLGSTIVDILEQHPLFMSYALPAQVVPPLFNAYRSSERYGAHVDGAIRPVAGHSIRIRTDISATLFLSDPQEYDGGELVVEDAEGTSRAYKLAAGTLLLYPSGSVHYVEPVRRGERLASFFWVQSMVRSCEQRAILFKLDRIVQHLRQTIPDDPGLVGLTGHYHNLVRLWADP